MMNMNNLAQTHEILTPQLATKVGLTKFEFYKLGSFPCWNGATNLTTILYHQQPRTTMLRMIREICPYIC